MRSHNVYNKKRGMTLVEVLVVIAIVGAISLAIFFTDTMWLGRSFFNHRVKELYSNILITRAWAMLHSSSLTYGIVFATSQYSMVVIDEVGKIVDEIIVDIDGINILSSGNLFFDSPSGNVTTRITIELTDTFRSRLISINSYGYVEEQ